MKFIADRSSGRLIDAETGKPVGLEKGSRKLAAPMLNSDYVDVRSPINDQRFDSKSSYYKHLAENGCHIVEHEHSQVKQAKQTRAEQAG